MLYKFQYYTAEDRQSIMEENTDKILIEEQNISDGNFLIFSDIPRLEEQLLSIQNTVDILLLKQEGIL